MKIYCIGDSLTEGDYGIKGKRCIPNVKPENYPYFLHKITGEKVINLGISGARPSTYLPLFNRYDFSDANYVIFLLGTNGGLDEETQTKDNDAYVYMIKSLIANVKNGKIILCTPPHATIDEKMSNYGYRGQVKKSAKFIRKVASEFNLYLLDLDDSDVFNDENEKIMQPNDGLHFGRKGYEKLAEIIYLLLKNNFKEFR